LSEWVVLELLLGGVQALRRGVRVHLSLVRVQLVKLRILVLLHVRTIGWVHASIHARAVHAHTRQLPTLLLRALSDVHASRVAHSVGLTAFVFRSEPILHERVVVSVLRHLQRRRVQVPTMETMNARLWVIHVIEQTVVQVSLVSGRFLSDSHRGGHSFRRGVRETIRAQARFGAIGRALGAFVLLSRSDGAHALRATSTHGVVLEKVRGAFGAVLGHVTHETTTTTGGVRTVIRSAWQLRELVLTHVRWHHSIELLETTNRGGVRAHAQTWTDHLLFNRGQVVHATLVVESVPHVEYFTS